MHVSSQTPARRRRASGGARSASTACCTLAFAAADAAEAAARALRAELLDRSTGDAPQHAAVAAARRSAATHLASRARWTPPDRRDHGADLASRDGRRHGDGVTLSDLIAAMASSRSHPHRPAVPRGRHAPPLEVRLDAAARAAVRGGGGRLRDDRLRRRERRVDQPRRRHVEGDVLRALRQQGGVHPRALRRRRPAWCSTRIVQRGGRGAARTRSRACARGCARSSS